MVRSGVLLLGLAWRCVTYLSPLPCPSILCSLSSRVLSLCYHSSCVHSLCYLSYCWLSLCFASEPPSFSHVSPRVELSPCLRKRKRGVVLLGLFSRRGWMEFVCVIALQWWRSDRGVMPIIPASSMFPRDLRDCVALLLSAALLCSSLLLCLLVWLRYVVRFYLLVLCKLEG